MKRYTIILFLVILCNGNIKECFLRQRLEFLSLEIPYNPKPRNIVFVVSSRPYTCTVSISFIVLKVTDKDNKIFTEGDM